MAAGLEDCFHRLQTRETSIISMVCDNLLPGTLDDLHDLRPGHFDDLLFGALDEKGAPDTQMIENDIDPLPALSHHPIRAKLHEQRGAQLPCGASCMQG